MNKSPLGPRLKAVAELVSSGAILADVGTDHGYLPIYLLECGKIERAVLSDVNEGPLKKAKDNVKLHNLEERVEFCLTNGAKALAGLGITDYAVCGMGGELIADIISAAPQLKASGVSLVLQPMSRPEAVRGCLWKSGFTITDEVYSADDGKLYVCMRAVYSGEKKDFTTVEEFFGEARFINPESLTQGEYISSKLRALLRAKSGKELGGMDTAYEDALIEYAKSVLNLYFPTLGENL